MSCIYLHLPSSTFICYHPPSFAIIHLHREAFTVPPFTTIFYLLLLLLSIIFIKFLLNDFLLSAFINYHLLSPIIIMHSLVLPFTCTIINLPPYPINLHQLSSTIFIKVVVKKLIIYCSVPSFTIINIHL